MGRVFVRRVGILSNNFSYLEVRDQNSLYLEGADSIMD